MHTEADSSGDSKSQVALRFSIKSLLILMLVLASFCTGWIAHRDWPTRKVEQTILNNIATTPHLHDSLKRAVEQGENVSVEFTEGPKGTNNVIMVEIDRR